jgi:hypothetical protein
MHMQVCRCSLSADVVTERPRCYRTGRCFWLQLGVIFVGGPPSPSTNVDDSLKFMLKWGLQQAMPLGMAVGAFFLLRERPHCHCRLSYGGAHGTHTHTHAASNLSLCAVAILSVDRELPSGHGGTVGDKANGGTRSTEQVAP